MTIASALNRNRIPSRPVPHPAQGTASWWLFRLEWVIILRLVRLVDRRDSNEAGAGLDTVMGGFDVVPGESRRLVQRAAAGDDPESRVCEQLFEFGRGVEAGVAVAWLSAGRAQSVQVGPRCPARQEPDNKAAAVGEQTPRFPEYGGRVGDETERECHEDRPEVPADERDRLADGIGDQDARRRANISASRDGSSPNRTPSRSAKRPVPTPISKRGWAKTSMSGRNAATSVARIGRPVGESYQAS